MGLPRLWGKVGGVATEGGVVGGATRGKEDEDRDDVSAATVSMKWTVAYYTILSCGIIAWWKGLWLLTESKSVLTKF